jgi:RNA polymerase sigma-70 factor (ECF subfamily)
LGNALVSILEDHGPRLYSLLVRLTLRPDVADDLLQDLFVKLSTSRRADAAGDLPAYARRVAINLAFDWRRDQSRQRRVQAAATMPQPAPPAWLKIADRELTERILSAASGLSPMSREAFVLRFVHDMPYDAIGASIGRTAHQARGLCHAAVTELRSRLGGFETEREKKNRSDV